MAIYSLHHRPITRTGKCAQKQPYTSAAHCSYITRESAVTAVISGHMPSNPSKACRWLKEMEDAEQRKNARFIEKIILALPVELDHEQRVELVQDYCAALSQGRVPWLAAIHDGPLDWDNPHAHLIFRDRDIETGKTVIKASDFKSTLRFRALWEEKANRHLERAGLEARIDRRTLEAQGIAREPGIHIGPRSRAMEDRGFRPHSKVIAVRRYKDGRVQTVRIDYAAIDQGRTRAAENDARQRRNGARGLGKKPPRWNTGAGMVAQQRSAAAWIKEGKRRATSEKIKDRRGHANAPRSGEDAAPLNTPAKEFRFFEDRHPPKDRGRDRSR